MTLLEDLRAAIEAEIAALPRRFPYVIAFAGDAEARTVAQVSDSEGWWETLLGGASLQPTALFLAASKAGKPLALVQMELGYISDVEPQGRLCAWAVDRALSLTERRRALLALMLPVVRALVSMGATTLVTNNVFTAEARNVDIFGRLATVAGSRVVSQRINRVDADDAQTLVWHLPVTLPALEVAV